ncbi:MAG: GTPase Era [Clostridiales bacterium]|nr:GTPase Era [Clostridiales bacterium]
MEKNFYSGFASIVGKPNVGKSTLMNALVGEKVAIISNKPQTTRNKITSVLTKEDYQIVFIDTPGFHKAKSKLGDYMVKSASSAIADVDIILFVVEPKAPDSGLELIEKLKTVKSDVFLVINKIDMVEKTKILEVISAYKNLFDFKEAVPISAYNRENLDLLLKLVRGRLPEGPMYFPEGMVTDQPERQIVSEIIREKILHIMKDEVPHGAAVEIVQMKKRQGKGLMDIEATIYCEKDSHKGMIIGKNGSALKEVGTRARYEIERLLGQPVNLKLWVKVKKGWRDSDFYLKNFGYDLKRE